MEAAGDKGSPDRQQRNNSQGNREGRPDYILVNCTCPLAQPVERSVGWGWLPERRQVEGTYGREATRRST